MLTFSTFSDSCLPRNLGRNARGEQHQTTTNTNTRRCRPRCPASFPWKKELLPSVPRRFFFPKWRGARKKETWGWASAAGTGWALRFCRYSIGKKSVFQNLVIWKVFLYKSASQDFCCSKQAYKLLVYSWWISHIGSFPRVWLNMKNIWNHHLLVIFIIPVLTPNLKVFGHLLRAIPWQFKANWCQLVTCIKVSILYVFTRLLDIDISALLVKVPETKVHFIAGLK